MKKVLCIDGVKAGAKGICSDGTIPICKPSWEIFEGEVYTVYKEINVCGKNGYILCERDYRSAYLTTRFIPLSNIDETEMEIERMKVIEYE